MIFYLIHNFINIFAENWKESRKNCFTLIIGATMYILLYVLLEYVFKTSGNLFIQILHRFFLYFVIVDIFTMAIIYKIYWGRSILNEGGDDDDWILTDDHKYKRKSNSEVSQDVSKTVIEDVSEGDIEEGDIEEVDEVDQKL